MSFVHLPMLIDYYMLAWQVLDLAFGKNHSLSVEDGVKVFGLYLDGARWDCEDQLLVDSLPGVRHFRMPEIHFIPVPVSRCIFCYIAPFPAFPARLSTYTGVTNLRAKSGLNACFYLPSTLLQKGIQRNIKCIDRNYSMAISDQFLSVDLMTSDSVHISIVTHSTTCYYSDVVQISCLCSKLS